MRQDEGNSIGAFGTLGGIKLVSHFRKNSPKQLSIAPRDRLLVFLRLDLADDNAIVDFMESYKIFPSGRFTKNIKKSLINAFRTEHATIKPIAQRAVKSSLEEADIELINSKLNGVKSTLKIVGEPFLFKVNENLNNSDKGEGTINKLHGTAHVIPTKKYANGFLAIYEDLYNLCLGKAKLKACRYCGNFFSPNRTNQIYCDAVHKEASRELKRAVRRKKTK